MPDRPVVSAPTDETARAVLDVEAALHLLTDISFGKKPDVAELHEVSLNAYAALRVLARREARDDTGRPSVGAGT